MFGPILLALCAIWASDLLGLTPLSLQQWQNLYQLVRSLLLVLLLQGPLAEELGWRGYALPRLEQERSALAASLILGLLWAGWHLPLFWVPDDSDAALIKGSPFAALWVLGFMINIVELSVLLTWLFNSTGGSVLLAGIFHASVGVASNALVLLNLWGNPAVAGLALLLFGFAAILVVDRTGSKRETLQLGGAMSRNPRVDSGKL